MNILEKIVENKKRQIAEMPDIVSPPTCKTDFKSLFTRRPMIIAEIKASSPSEGRIVEDFKPMDIAEVYLEGGADALSILTDKEFFGGSFDILRQVSERTEKPILCKEFIIDEKQIRYARACGADLCLLIVKILSSAQLHALKAATEKWGMKAVVEVQTKAELQIALAVSPEILLINNRNLSDFSVDMTTAVSLLNEIPDHVKVIAASGIQTPKDIKKFSNRIDGFLIGTALMRAKDRVDFLRRCRV